MSDADSICNQPETIIKEIKALYYSGKYFHALELCRHHYHDFKENTEFLLYYKNSIYQLYLKKIHLTTTNFMAFHEKIPELFKAANAIVTLTPDFSKDKVSNFALLNFIKFLYKSLRNNAIVEVYPNWYASICYFSKYINPDCLIQTQISGNQNNQHVISPQLQYYFITANACYHEGNYEQAITIALKALNGNYSFPFDYDLWLHRICALSLMKMKKFNDGIDIYKKNILPRKKDWFLFYELASMYAEIKEDKIAIHYLVKALEPLALLKKNIKLKYKVIFNLLLLLKKNQMLEFFEKLSLSLGFSCNITELCSDKLTSNLHQQILIACSKPEKINFSDLFRNISELKSYSIEDNISKTEKKFIGKVVHINLEKNFGFIRSESFPENVYFRPLTIKNFKEIRLNSTVEFHTKNSFDKKKNKNTIMAVLVRVMNEKNEEK